MMGPFATASRCTPHYHSPGVANVASHAACASMSTTTTTTTTRDRGDRYGPMEWAQQTDSERNTTTLNPGCYDQGRFLFAGRQQDTDQPVTCLIPLSVVLHDHSPDRQTNNLSWHVVLQSKSTYHYPVTYRALG